MNQLLDSPLEALAFNYVSFGIFTVVNNLWALVAVVTAGLSFWRIRAAAAAAGATTSAGCVQSDDQKPSLSISDRARDESRPIPEAGDKLTPSASVVETSVSPLAGRGVTKGGKFKVTVYYEDDREKSDVDVDGEMTGTGWSDGGGDCNEWWERVLRLRNGEMGWYRYQDLAALNGNVVRLWDESCRCRRRR
ncbi:hypothetical protein like AT5G20790 [Hibiscus trionum]|uniref:Plant invertase/pectin methylesterase inhibitor superfamily protein n=1 Tax=Hibiscus trionum TaxID=183268 RepID=A0A9W7J360_HIBTR|nr:hypothetical protein like AT5G20790 [Hibiscus trionum]